MFNLGAKFNGMKVFVPQYSVNLLLLEVFLSMGLRFSKKILIKPIRNILTPKKPNATPNNADSMDSLMPSANSVALGLSRF